MYSRIAVGLFVTLLAACEVQPTNTDRSCTLAYARERCAWDPEEPACRWAALLDARIDAAAIAEVVGGGADDVDDALRRLFPSIGDRAIGDAPLLPPDELVLELSGFPAYTFEGPIEWDADPYGNNSWRFWFQNLGWLYDFYLAEGADLNAGAYVLVDWAERVLLEEPALEWTWNDHAIAVRLDRTSEFMDRYLREREPLNRRLLLAAARILLSHAYALGSDACYTPAHNHGVMQDLALLEHLPRYPAMRHQGDLLALARARLYEQVQRSVTPDGIHIENSPHYHAFYTELLTRAIGIILGSGEAAPAELIDIRDRLLLALVHQLQPNHTLPQFGDSENGTWRPRLAAVVEAVRQQGFGDADVLAQLDWVLTWGARGERPRHLDRVFEIGGYAAFRSSWEVEDFLSPITGHFTSTSQSLTHDHADETSFEIYGHGSELVIDSGLHNYDLSDPSTQRQYVAESHNVLTVDGARLDSAAEASITAHGHADDVSWVQGAHAGYAHVGVRSLVRTFAHAKPDTFVIVDHIQAERPGDYAQHFHLHPDLSDVRVVDGAVVARFAREGGGPALVLAPAVQPDEVEIAESLYFPRQNEVVPTIDVVLHHRRQPREIDLPVVIVVVAPGQPVVVPAPVRYGRQPYDFTVHWSGRDGERSISVPSP